jgi:hypothetical protein
MWVTVGQPRRTWAATARRIDRPPSASLRRNAEVEARSDATPIKGLTRQTAERGAGRAEIADAGQAGDVWAEDNSRPRGGHIGANVFSNFRRTKYQNARRDWESASRRGGGDDHEILGNEIPGACRSDRRAGRGLRCFCQQPSPRHDGLRCRLRLSLPRRFSAKCSCSAGLPSIAFSASHSTLMPLSERSTGGTDLPDDGRISLIDSTAFTSRARPQTAPKRVRAKTNFAS